jgi:hypothetical protein
MNMVDAADGMAAYAESLSESDVPYKLRLLNVALQRLRVKIVQCLLLFWVSVFSLLTWVKVAAGKMLLNPDMLVSRLLLFVVFVTLLLLGNHRRLL